jgi:hypothetical protein
MDRVTHGRVERAGFEERKPVGNRAALDKGQTGGNRTEAKPSSGGASKVYRPPPSASKSASNSGGGGKKP